jgi:signal peptidase I
VARVGAVLGWLAVLLVLVVAAAGIAMRLGGAAPLLAIPTTSMEPTLRPGDLVWVRTVPAAEVRAGDVVAVRVPALVRRAYGVPPVVVHRVVAVLHRRAGLFLQTKGDANPAPDPFVTPAADVIGVVARVFRGWGWPVLFFYSRWGLGFLASLAGIGLALAAAEGAAHVARGLGQAAAEPLRRAVEEPLSALEQRVAAAYADELARLARELAEVRALLRQLAAAPGVGAEGDPPVAAAVPVLVEGREETARAAERRAHRARGHASGPAGEREAVGDGARSA